MTETSKPLVLLNHNQAEVLSRTYHGRVGVIMGPSKLRPTYGLPFALDNDRFRCWSHGKDWDEFSYLAMLDKLAGSQPLWVVVPDVVADAVATLREWEKWSPKLRAMGLMLAFAVQDGTTPDTVRQYVDADVIFVGGTTTWKRRTLWLWCRSFARVHCGRVNSEKHLWNAHRCGCESTDGTGWFRGDQHQRKGLLRYLERSQADLGPRQLEIEFSGVVE